MLFLTYVSGSTTPSSRPSRTRRLVFSLIPKISRRERVSLRGSRITLGMLRIRMEVCIRKYMLPLFARFRTRIEHGQLSLIRIGSADDKLYWALTGSDNWTFVCSPPFIFVCFESLMRHVRFGRSLCRLMLATTIPGSGPSTRSKD